MKLKSIGLALLIAGALVAVEAPAQEEGMTQEKAKEMAFGQLSEEKQKQVIAMLKKIFKDAKGKAEKSIRENGSMVPYGYAANNQGQGQFLHIDPEQKLKAEMAAHAIQKTIITNAVRGDLAASGMFLTMGVPQGLQEETRKKLEKSIKGDRGIEDVRFLMVELQHLGGLGLLMTVPYWQSDEGKWVFGEPVSQQVSPELQRSVQRIMRKASQKQGSGGSDS
ncbi:hypothetical protein DES49_1660 [Halospina denitrificans]|uniref:Uncharacterized protein n=1 Tax=Halospina denitrificans TaxID=332522 RepID=A0A4R7JUG8_9GAMM|nr:hypothetical protein [Halospina denitrificans]TDT41564.1 hypothetical protein DES49_1660 [Halospina denitrificans]